LQRLAVNFIPREDSCCWFAWEKKHRVFKEMKKKKRDTCAHAQTSQATLLRASPFPQIKRGRRSSEKLQNRRFWGGITTSPQKGGSISNSFWRKREGRDRNCPISKKKKNVLLKKKVG